MNDRIKALEGLRAALDAAHTAAIAVGDSDFIGQIADLLGDCASALDSETAAETPCSDEARWRGCTCTTPYGEYEPEPRIDRYCPLHGIDPDMARDDQKERTRLFDEAG